MVLERLNALWFGDQLRYMEQLSIVSAMDAGHPVTVYSYTPDSLTGVPSGAKIGDARDVMSDERRTRLLQGRYRALGSDFFRYEVFAKGLGYWVDLDVLVLKPLAFEEEHVFGWEHATSINGAVLRLPQASKMLAELRNIPESNWCPPYFGPRRKAAYYFKRLTSAEVRLEDLPWGAVGPAMITYLARKYDTARLAQPKSVFYPLDYDQATKLFEHADVVEAMIEPNTLAVHMWNSKLRGLVDRPPPPGSYVDVACRKHGIL